ncbi:hypothetical protein ACJZ2D_011214 [Fusarium nematophilum]
MGFLDWNDGASIISGKSSHRRRHSSRSRHKKRRSRSRSRSSSRDRGRSFADRSSYYKRSPRQGFIQKSYKQVKRLLRDLVHWAKRHPWKVFFLVIMPLITGGALTALLARFGLRIPPAIERMLGVASKAATGGSVGLVGEAVKMASNFGGNASVHMERDTRSFGGGDGNWGGGLADMAKKWM